LNYYTKLFDQVVLFKFRYIIIYISQQSTR